MTELPSPLTQGERARLFPVLADTSKEGRTLSILLSCIENVHELGQNLLSDFGVRVGARTKIECYTEVCFPKGNKDKKLRPDGLIVIQNGSKKYTALVEAKIGKNELKSDQIEGYLEIAKQNGIDTLITISNQFSPLPTVHPVSIGSSAKKKANLIHWSWMHILTESKLLLDNSDVQDIDQRIILNEMVRFLSHDSAGVTSFTQMPKAWTKVVSTVQAGGALPASSDDSKEVIGAWHQEARDLSLILSRQLSRNVGIKIQRKFLSDHTARIKSDAQVLHSEKCLKTTILIPNAASSLEIIADLKTRCISVSMRLKAPSDRKSTKARINWLLRQIPETKEENLHVRLIWPGRGPYTQVPLKQLRETPQLENEGLNATVSSFEIVMVKDCGSRFGQSKNFIVDLEGIVPDFYEKVGQHLREWQEPAPRIKEAKSKPSNVNTKSIQEEADNMDFNKDEIINVIKE